MFLFTEKIRSILKRISNFCHSIEIKKEQFIIMLFSFQLAPGDRGRLLGVGGETINCLRNTYNCREILVRDDNKLTIGNDDI